VLLAVSCLSAGAQTTEDAIRARLIGKPLYLRGLWIDYHLKFDAAGVPVKHYRADTFTESGIDVHDVKLTSDGLRIDGERIGLIFPKSIPTRIRLHTDEYDSSIRIEIKSPPDGNFDKALNAIFTTNLGSLTPSLPDFWQGYARKYFPLPASEGASGRTLENSPPVNTPADTGIESPFHIAGAIKPPVEMSTRPVEITSVAKALKASGHVLVYLWVLPDGSVSHLRIATPFGLGMDEQAISAVSYYQFKPATKDGKPVKVDLYVDLQFGVFQPAAFSH
jgi:TonB family protein